jgi:NitT/TauT family transport system substrate-binding protein
LKQDVTLATTVGNKHFPPHEATLIAGIVRRDLPYYEAAITPASVTAINEFARDIVC